MKVKLLTKTQNMLDVVYTGARTCYNAGSPIDMWFDVCNIPTDKKKTMLSKVFESGHLSTSEHAYFTFAIEGISRACSHQLVRTRIASFSQQSQRYVEIKENQDELYEAFNENYDSTNYKDSKIFKILDKYFVDADNFRNVNGYYYALDNYLEAIKMGEPAQDARRFLPNATKTNIVMSLNLRSFMHLCNERLCTRAQGEIRQVVKEMVKEVVKVEPWLKPYLVPKCILLKGCNEHKSCGYYEANNKG